MKDRIFSFIQKPSGRGNLRCWVAWRFPASTSQNDVQNFMLAMGYDATQYFLQMESDLTVGKKYPYHYYRTSTKSGKSYWVYYRDAKVVWDKKHKKVSFMVVERWK